MSEDTEMARYVIYGLDGDPELPCIGVCQNQTDMGPYLVNLVGADNPCYVFKDLPMEILTADEIGANFNNGMMVSSDFQTNRNRVADQYDNPAPVGPTNDGTNVAWRVS